MAVFTLGARALVPGHWHKMVLCSDTGYPGNQCLVQCPSTRSRPCPNSGMGFWKKGVFTLVPIKNGSQAPCVGTKSERSLWLCRWWKPAFRHLTTLLDTVKPYSGDRLNIVEPICWCEGLMVRTRVCKLINLCLNPHCGLGQKTLLSLCLSSPTL